MERASRSICEHERKLFLSPFFLLSEPSQGRQFPSFVSVSVSNHSIDEHSLGGPADGGSSHLISSGIHSGLAGQGLVAGASAFLGTRLFDPPLSLKHLQASLLSCLLACLLDLFRAPALTSHRAQNKHGIKRTYKHKKKSCVFREEITNSTVRKNTNQAGALRDRIGHS